MDDMSDTQIVVVELTESTLERWKSELDQRHFDGLLKNIPVHFESMRPGHFGAYGPSGIAISESLKRDHSEARSTLVHEMVHAYLAAIGDPCSQRRNSGHGAAFAAQVRRLVAAGEDVLRELDYATCASADDETVARAAESVLLRESRVERIPGSYDRSGRWHPADEEWQDCCSSIRPPSRAYPFTYLKHCLSVTHVSHVYGVDTIELRKKVRALRKRS